MTSTIRPVLRRSRTSRGLKRSIWRTEMCRRSTLLFAVVLAFVGSATAAPVTPFAPALVSPAPGWSAQSGDSGLILVQRRGGGGRAGGGAARSAGRANRGGGFNSNEFHRNVSNTGNFNASRGANINANRNVNVSGGGYRGGGCCYGNYNTGPSWGGGGVAAGVAVGAMGAMVGAAASSSYAAPPPYYPPGYVTPPPY
jgi:hypothetical protein